MKEVCAKRSCGRGINLKKRRLKVSKKYEVRWSNGRRNDERERVNKSIRPY